MVQHREKKRALLLDTFDIQAWEGHLLSASRDGRFYLGAPQLAASHLLNMPLPREVGSDSTAA